METTEKIIAVMQKKIAVMQGHQDGKAVQYRPWHGGTWINTSSTALWNWHAFNYRIKPEPKTVMMQMVQLSQSMNLSLRAFPVNQAPFNGAWLKVGEPFEFVYPEESE